MSSTTNAGSVLRSSRGRRGQLRSVVSLSAIGAALLFAAGCKNSEKEVERTKAQLAQMGRQIGAEAAVTAVEGQYKQNLAPMVDATATELAKSETYRTVRQGSSDAYDSVAATGSAAYQTTRGWFADFPEDEKELESMVDGWTKGFLGWLGLTNGGVHARGRRSFASLAFTGPGPGKGGVSVGGPASTSSTRVRTALIGGSAGSHRPGR